MTHNTPTVPEPSPHPPIDPTAALDQLGVIWSDDFDAYASGQLDASQVHCALCMCAPCRCPVFGTPAYFALVDFRHGPLTIAIGCVGGRHRSAAVATEVARILESQGTPVVLTHRDLDRPVIKRPVSCAPEVTR